MKKIFDLPKDAQVHSMCTCNDHVFIYADNAVWSFYVPPKTIWMKIKDLFIRGKDWIN